MIGRLAQNSAVHVLVAFALMGSWAVHANWGHPMPKPVLAGLVQGALSGAITYALKRGLDGLRGRMRRDRGWWLPPVAACSVSLCLLAGAHLAAGTPEVLKTISVPFTVASLYAATYNVLMWTKEGAA